MKNESMLVVLGLFKIVVLKFSQSVYHLIGVKIVPVTYTMHKDLSLYLALF